MALVTMGPVVDITKTPMYMAIPMRRKHMRFLISHRPFLNISLNHQRLNDVLARDFQFSDVRWCFYDGFLSKMVSSFSSTAAASDGGRGTISE